MAALYTVTAGNTAVAADLNQLVNLLNGTTTNVPARLNNAAAGATDVILALGSNPGSGGPYGLYQSSASLPNRLNSNLMIRGHLETVGGITMPAATNLTGTVASVTFDASSNDLRGQITVVTNAGVTAGNVRLFTMTPAANFPNGALVIVMAQITSPGNAPIYMGSPSTVGNSIDVYTGMSIPASTTVVINYLMVG